MMYVTQKLKVMIFSLLVTCLMIGGLQVAMARQDDRPTRPSPINIVKNILEKASAPALSSDQETQITALVTALQEARQSQTPDENLKAAHEAYNAAILAGNESAANAQAAVIANLQTAFTTKRLKDDASFKIHVLGVLTAAQKTALTASSGEEGLSRLLGALAGGPGGFGGPGRGPGGPGRPGGFGRPDGPPPNAIRRGPGN